MTSKYKMLRLKRLVALFAFAVLAVPAPLYAGDFDVPIVKKSDARDAGICGFCGEVYPPGPERLKHICAAHRDQAIREGWKDPCPMCCVRHIDRCTRNNKALCQDFGPELPFKEGGNCPDIDGYVKQSCAGGGGGGSVEEGPGTGARKLLDKGFRPLEDWLRNRAPASDPSKYYSPADAAAQTGGILKSRGEGAQPNLPSSVPTALKPINMRSPRQAAARPEPKEPEKPVYKPDVQLRELGKERGLLPGQISSGIPRSGRSAQPRGVAKVPSKPKNSEVNRKAPSRGRNPDEGESEDRMPAQSTDPRETEDMDEAESGETLTPVEPIIDEDAEEIELDDLGAQICPKGSEAENRGRLLAALGHYRNCLFDKEMHQERPDMDRTALYRLIVRAAGWMEPPLELPQRSLVAMDTARQAEEPLKHLHEALYYAPWWIEPHYQIAIRQSLAPDSEDVQVHLTAFLAAAPTEDPRVKDAEEQLRSKEYVHQKHP